MNAPADKPPRSLRSGPFRLIAGLLMIVEGAIASFLAAFFVATPGGLLPVLAMLAVMSGAAICWAGALLAGFITGNRRAAAVLVLVLGAALALFGFAVMVFISCGGGVNCPYRMQAHVYALPIAFAAFNAICAAMLWQRQQLSA